MSDSDQDNSKKNDKPSDFVVGSIAFIIFLIFMTIWMMFVPEGR